MSWLFLLSYGIHFDCNKYENGDLKNQKPSQFIRLQKLMIMFLFAMVTFQGQYSEDNPSKPENLHNW